MAIDPRHMLAQLSPSRPFDFSAMAGDPQAESRRQQLALMRQQFEETKRRNLEDERLRKESEAGEQARAQLALQRQREADAAAVALQQERDAAAAERELADDKRATFGDLYKYRDAADTEGMESRLPQMQALGMLAERQGEGRYRLGMDAEAAQAEEDARLAETMPADPYEGNGLPMPSDDVYGPGDAETSVQSLSRLNALGSPLLNERTPVDITEPGIRTSDDNDAASRFTAAVDHHNATGEAIRGPDEVDYMASVPEDVIDIGAEQAQIAKRLDPALGALRSAYAPEYQDSVEQTNQAAAGMNLPATKALELAQSLRTGVDPTIARGVARDETVSDDERNHQWALEKEERERQAKIDEVVNKPLDPLQIETLAKGGEARAKETYENFGIKNIRTTEDAATNVIRLLKDNKPGNDKMVAFQLTRFLGSIGPQANKDVDIATGTESLSAVGRAREFITGFMEGGYSPEHKQMLIKVVEDALAESRENVYSFLDLIEASASQAADPRVARGLRDFAARNVEQDYRDAWQAAEDGEEEAGAEAAPGAAPAAPAVPGKPRPIGSVQADGRPDPRYTRTDDSFANGPVDDAEEEAPAADDDGFQAELAKQAQASGLDAEKMGRIMGPESGHRGDAVNPKSGATGIIQFMPGVAQKLGTSVEALKKMPRKDQIKYATKYFSGWGLTADSPVEDYALAVAAPGYIGAPDTTVIKEYKEGTPAWRDNPQWRGANGQITVGDILRFYGLRGGKAPAEEEGDEEAPAPAKKAQPTARHELDQETLDILR